MRSAALISTTFMLLALSTPAVADYPERPITIVVPFGVGGSSDIGVRIWAPYLERCLGGRQSIVVVNKPGASGQLGFTEVATSPADGYTLSALNIPNLQLPTITKNDTAYTVESFDYLGTFFSSRTVLNVQKNSDIDDVSELIARVRESGNPLKLGISAIASDDHLFGLQLRNLAGIDIEFVPFGDGISAYNALVGGHIEVATTNIPIALTNPDATRPLAVAAEEPVKPLPGVPTFKQAGIDIVYGSDHPFGAPKGLPEDVRAKLASCVEAIAQDPEFQAEAEKRGFLLNPMNAEETTALITDGAATLKALWESDPWE